MDRLIEDGLPRSRIKPMMSPLSCAEQRLARGLGWECIPDPSRGPGWCRFHYQNIHVWRIKDGWRRARLIGQRNYIGDQTWPTLQDALTKGSVP